MNSALPTEPLDLTDAGLAAWKVLRDDDLRRIIDRLAARETWVDSGNDPEFVEAMIGLGRDLQAFADSDPRGLADLFENDDFLASLQLCLVYVRALPRTRLIAWFSDAAGDRPLERLLQLPPVDAEPEILQLDAETSIKSHEPVIFLRSYLHQLRRQRVAQRVFAPERLAYLVERILERNVRSPA